jgi:hypothetical protein
VGYPERLAHLAEALADADSRRLPGWELLRIGEEREHILGIPADVDFLAK